MSGKGKSNLTLRAGICPFWTIINTSNLMQIVFLILVLLGLFDLFLNTMILGRKFNLVMNRHSLQKLVKP